MIIFHLLAGVIGGWRLADASGPKKSTTSLYCRTMSPILIRQPVRMVSLSQEGGL
jgi:hypothetical protein